MSADSPGLRARLLLDEFKAAVETERIAREAYKQNPGNADLLRDWLRAMDATNEASKKLRLGTE